MPTLTWIGKDKVVTHHKDVPYRVLTHKYGFNSANPEDKSETHSGNKIIHGDNLEALKSLLPEYEGRIDVVYIDPPYNTGEEKWIYNDNVNDPKIQKWLGEVVGSQGEDFSRHDKWLCMMYPRLQLLQKLLSQQGVIFVSINYKFEEAHLRMMLDEIFGDSNYVGMLTWESTTQPINAGSAKFRLQNKVEPILFYCKNKSCLPIFRLEEIDSGLRYPHRGKFSPCRFEIIEKSDAGGYQRNTMKFPIMGQIPRDGKRWQIGYETAQKLLEAGKIEIVDGIVKKAVYPEDEEDKRKFIPFWSHLPASKVGTALSGKELLNDILGYAVGFDTVKPPQLIEELLSHFSKEAIVLDSFAGSGTTAHAVLNANKLDGGNRKFIMIEMEDYAERITAERIRRVSVGYPTKNRKEVVLCSQKLTVSNLKHIDKFLSEAERVQNDNSSKYDDVKMQLINNSINVVGAIEKGHVIEGLGCSFDFYELGERMFDDNGDLNKNIDEDKIREYIFFTETKQHMSGVKSDAGYCMGDWNDTSYYFYYKRGSATTLSFDALMKIVDHKAEQYIIYADICTISDADLAKRHIIFKKIPRDITKF